MPFSFPSSPTVGQQSTQNNRVYQWTGSAWELVATPSQIVTSVDGLSGAVTVTKAAIYEFTRSSKPAAATGSNGSYSWSLPAGAKLVEFFMIGGGGGGGSGRRGAPGTARYGGGGGSSAGVVHTTVMASLITTSLTVTVGAGGGGGASQTANDTNGNAGSAGSATSIVFNSSATNVLNAEFGQGGGGGSTTAGTAGAFVSNRITTYRGNSGQSANVTNLASIPEGIAVNGNVALPGAAGGSMDGASNIYTPGSVVLPSTFFAVSTQIGSNVGGGAASNTGNAGSGSSGAGYGYGGCGGGSATNSTGNSGAGGNGGDGYVRITVWS